MKFTFFYIAFLFYTVVSSSQTGSLTVDISEIKNNEGNIKVAIYDENGSSGFLKDIETAYDKKIAHIKNGKATVIFSNLPFGTYAVSVFHDQNNNGELELAPLGFPTEPYGVSGDQESGGIPNFKKSKFEFNSEKRLVSIQMKSFSLK